MNKMFLILCLLLAAIPAYALGPEANSGMHTELCKDIAPGEIPALFDEWNKALLTGDARKVAALYAERSILLPTMSNKPRLTFVEKEDYFRHFLENEPSGKINERFIQLGCNTALDTGLYTFTLTKTGQTIPARYTFTYRWTGTKWLITSHHSSAMPERSPEKK